jgi:hypothetical protein
MSILARIQILGGQALYVFAGMGLSMGCGTSLNCNDKGLVLLMTSFFFILYVNLRVGEDTREYMSKNLVLLALPSFLFLGFAAIKSKREFSDFQLMVLMLLTVLAIFVGANVKFPYVAFLKRKMAAPAIAVIIFSLQEMLVLFLTLSRSR